MICINPLTFSLLPVSLFLAFDFDFGGFDVGVVFPGLEFGYQTLGKETEAN